MSAAKKYRSDGVIHVKNVAGFFATAAMLTVIVALAALISMMPG